MNHLCMYTQHLWPYGLPKSNFSTYGITNIADVDKFILYLQINFTFHFFKTEDN